MGGNEQPDPEQPVAAAIPHPYSHKCGSCEAVKFASERIHTLIAEENGLRNNRMTWFANIEGFLWVSFAALLATVGGREEKEEGSFPKPVWFWLMFILPIIGVLICVFTIVLICDAGVAVRTLQTRWTEIQGLSNNCLYGTFPVVGLTYDELDNCTPISLGCLRYKVWFTLVILAGWIACLVGVTLVSAS